jgi:hypothetical protein
MDRKMGRCWRSAALVGALGLVLSACSTAPYKPPVDAFADATNKAVSISSTLTTEMGQDHTASLDQKRVQKNWAIGTKAGDCEIPSQEHDETSSPPRCRMVVGPVARQGALLIDDPLPTLTGLTAGLVRYAAALQGIVNADTTAKVDASVAAAAASIKSMATTLTTSHDVELQKANAALAAAATDKQREEATAKIASLNASVSQTNIDTVGDYASAGGNAVAWLLGQYIAYEQVAALRSATKEARAKIDEVGVELDAIAEETFLLNEREKAKNRVDVAFIAWGNSNKPRISQATKDAALVEFKAAVVAYDQLLVASHSGMFRAMADAHDSLADKLAGKQSLTEVAAAIQAFSQQVDGFQKVVAELQAAREQARADAAKRKAVQKPNTT